MTIPERQAKDLAMASTAQEVFDKAFRLYGAFDAAVLYIAASGWAAYLGHRDVPTTGQRFFIGTRYTPLRETTRLVRDKEYWNRFNQVVLRDSNSFGQLYLQVDMHPDYEDWDNLREEGSLRSPYDAGSDNWNAWSSAVEAAAKEMVEKYPLFTERLSFVWPKVRDFAT